MVNGPGFFKYYIPSLSQENQKIPPRFVLSVQGTWPMNLALRDRYNNLWNVKVEKVGGDWYFKDGWTKFADDNKIKGGDMLVYEYFSQGLLDVKVHGRSSCLIEGVGGRKTDNSEEQIIKIESDDDVGGRKTDNSEEQIIKIESDDDVVGHADEMDCDPIDKGENSRDDSDKFEQAMDDDTDDYDSSTEEENQQDDHEQATDDTDDDRSVPAAEEENRRFDLSEAEEEKDDDTNDEDYVPTTKRANQQDANPVEKEATNVYKRKRMTQPEVPRDDTSQRNVVRDGTASSSREGTRRDFDWLGVEIFKTGLVPQPRVHYFVTKILRNRPGELYIPNELIRTYKLVLPETVTLLDPDGRKFSGKRKIWSDGRKFYFGGWKALCKANKVEYEDTCICELLLDGDDPTIRVSFFPPK